MHLVYVPPERVGEFWPLARPYVSAAMERASLRTVAGAEYDALTGQAQLWLAITSDQQVIGAGVTEIIGPACWIIAWGSDDQKRCAPLLEVIEEFARENGCARVRLCGRLGWQRVLPGFKPQAVVLEKELG